MYRITILILFVAIIVAGNGQDVKLVAKAPDKVYAGSEFIVNVTISKTEDIKFGRFNMKIPSGFTPFEKVSKNGKYEFDGENLKILWLKLPDDNIFNVSFALKAAPNVEGYKVLKGEFSFVDGENNTRKKELKPLIITVEKGEQIETGEDVVFEYEYIKEQGVSCIRQKPFLNDSNEVVINILVNKGDINQFGKIQEQVPPNYTAESLVSNGAIFVFNKTNRQVKFLWMNMPFEEQFIISYELKPVEGVLENVPFIITGEFMYAEGKTTKTIKIVERNIELKKMITE